MENKPICEIDKDGNKYWYLDGKFHRADGPAIEYSNGVTAWYLNGQRHREDGPAVIFTNGTKIWYINDQCHRLDGPAYINIDIGTTSWVINNNDVTDKITTWAKENSIDLNNLIDVDKALIKIAWADYNEWINL